MDSAPNGSDVLSVSRSRLVLTLEIPAVGSLSALCVGPALGLFFAPSVSFASAPEGTHCLLLSPEVGLYNSCCSLSHSLFSHETGWIRSRRLNEHLAPFKVDLGNLVDSKSWR